MNKKFVLPISVEEFAAYLDGNLSHEEMEKVESFIANDEAIRDITMNCQAIDDTMTNSEPLELLIPDEISFFDFEIPSIDDSILNDDFFDFSEVAACAESTIMNGVIETDDVGVDAHKIDNIDVLDHSELSDYTTENNNNILMNQDGVDIDDTPESNDIYI